MDVATRRNQVSLFITPVRGKTSAAPNFTIAKKPAMVDCLDNAIKCLGNIIVNHMNHIVCLADLLILL